MLCVSHNQPFKILEVSPLDYLVECFPGIVFYIFFAVFDMFLIARALFAPCGFKQFSDLLTTGFSLLHPVKQRSLLPRKLMSRCKFRSAEFLLFSAQHVENARFLR